jgi:hypothetical protein
MDDGGIRQQAGTQLERQSDEKGKRDEHAQPPQEEAGIRNEGQEAVLQLQGERGDHPGGSAVFHLDSQARH